MVIPSGWVQIFRGPLPKSEQWPPATARPTVANTVTEGCVNQARSVVLAQESARATPDNAMSAAPQKVTSLEAALNVLVGHSGPEVDVLKAVPQKAKEAARERPLTE